MIFTNEYQELQVRLLQACAARRRASQVQAGEARQQYYAVTDAQGTTVLLGNKTLADAQRAADEAEGLVARICRGER